MGASQLIRPFRGKTDLLSRKIEELVRVGRKTFTDDPIIKQPGKKHQLKADAVYTAGKPGSPVKYAYVTDSRGRVVQAHARPLDLVPGPRGYYYSNTPGKLPGDDAGHIFAHIFGGSDTLENLVSQAAHANHSRMNKLEIEWKKALEEIPPKQVQVDIEIQYGAGDRPIGFKVIHKIGDALPRTTRFANV